MVNIIFHSEDLPIPGHTFLDKLTDFLLSILDEHDITDRAVNLVLCDDEFIHSLNRDYRHIDMPTDVLSFPQDEGEQMINPGDEEIDLGDVILSVDRACVQAQEFGVSLEEEFARLAIHGVLHLLGYDHETSDIDEAEMMKLQDGYVEKFLNSLAH